MRKRRIQGVIFDYGFTLSSELYFNVAPEGIEGWRTAIQREVFDRPEVVRAWMVGEIGLTEIAGIVSETVDVERGEVLDHLRQGCECLSENQAVKDLAVRLKEAGIPIGLVTANFDVFNTVVVPAHGYDQLFDVIVNSCDYGTVDKRLLWPVAFAEMGNAIGYHNTLLIEDGERELNMYREMGGQAIEYREDEELLGELIEYEFVV